MGVHHWGWLVAIYLFLGGMGAGAFLVAALVELTGERYRHDFCPTTLVGAGVSGPLIIIGTVMLIFDLGAGKIEPWRILYMFTHFTSVMTWGIWILSIFIPLCLLYALCELLDVYPGLGAWLKNRFHISPGLPLRRTKRVVASIGSIFAIATAVYTGVLLGVVRAVPLWYTPILPVLFLISAISTGMGLTIDLSATIAIPEIARRFRSMPIIHMVLIGLEGLLIGLFLAWAFMSGGTAAQSARAIVAGHLSVVFWVGVVLPGLIYPFIVHAYAFGAGRHSLVSGIGSGIGIVVAGLFLRYLIVAGGIPVSL